MRCKWLVVSAILLILFTWTSVIAGPKAHTEHGDDDIPELIEPKRWVTSEKIIDRLELGSVLNSVFFMDRGDKLEVSKKQGAERVRVPAARRYPIRFK